MDNPKIKSFTDLVVWQKGHDLVLNIYKTIKTFPSEERYALSDQMRRCSVSITSNIAEGFSRQGKKEKLQFYFIAKGSLTELQNQLLVARDVDYLSILEYSYISEKVVNVQKLLNGLIRSLQKRSP